MFENDVVFKICPFTKKMYQTTYVYLYHWAVQVVWSWFYKVKQLPGQAATYPLAATCSHLQFQAATCSYKRPLAATSSHLQLQAATCSYTLPFAWATTCSHWQPEAATCCHWQVAGKWLEVAVFLKIKLRTSLAHVRTSLDIVQHWFDTN